MNFFDVFIESRCEGFANRCSFRAYVLSLCGFLWFIPRVQIEVSRLVRILYKYPGLLGGILSIPNMRARISAMLTLVVDVPIWRGR